MGDDHAGDGKAWGTLALFWAGSATFIAWALDFPGVVAVMIGTAAAAVAVPLTWVGALRIGSNR